MRGGAGAGAPATPPAWRLGLAVPGVTVPASDALPLWLATAAALVVHEVGALSAWLAAGLLPCTWYAIALRLAFGAPGFRVWRAATLSGTPVTCMSMDPAIWAGRACSGGSCGGHATANPKALPSVPLHVEHAAVAALKPCHLGPSR